MGLTSMLGRSLEGKDMEALARGLLELGLKVASGQRVKAEAIGYREIAIFKTGVAL